MIESPSLVETVVPTTFHFMLAKIASTDFLSGDKLLLFVQRLTGLLPDSVCCERLLCQHIQVVLNVWPTMATRILLFLLMLMLDVRCHLTPLVLLKKGSYLLIAELDVFFFDENLVDTGLLRVQPMHATLL